MSQSDRVGCSIVSKNPQFSKDDGNGEVDISFILHVCHWGGIGDVHFAHGSFTWSQADRTTIIWNIAGHEQSGMHGSTSII